MSEPAGRVVGTREGRPAWALAAFEVLVETAERYNAVVVYSDLADQVQRRSGMATRALQRNWIGKVLSDVVVRCHQEGLPPLTALVVHKSDGQVGVGYDEVLRVAGLDPIDDQAEREEHAASARLECYRRWCANVPADAAPTLSDRMQEVASRRRLPTVVRVGEMCKLCFLQKPTSGQCPQCEG